ncbi:hypothetical protein GCM10025867_20050 [Frondihabitans sucicola]|uniref:ABC transporter permease n=1 Tax=Frondihabitans sucicola TaxID=1268041 RepID=A0ABM8GMW5_9MICO|nr:hypothetical protein [Frondihabitans sucicola]BDZ49764.1 hypothetical protein GCM10025867_20050 [Frondihabitans sucicola]
MQRDRLVRSLTRWELRGASKLQRREIGGGRLRDEDVYVYPGDSGVESSLSDAIVVVVPNPSAVFSADQLGSWLSTGDVVFTSARVADRAIATSDVHDQFSAVVAVGQDAAERARHAGTAVRVTIAALVAAVVVVVLLSLLATTAHRRRHGRALFARTAAGHSFARVNVGVLVAEAAVLAVGAVSTVNAWWDRHPDGTGRTSVLDPIARSAATGGLEAGGAVIVLAAVGTAVIAWTSLRTERTRGNEA